MEDPPPTTPTDPCSLLDLPDKCLALVMQLLAQQGKKRSLRRLAKTNSRLHALALPIQSATLSVSIQTRKQLRSLGRWLQRHGQLVRQLRLQSLPGARQCDDSGSYGVCCMDAPLVKELPSTTTPSALSIQYLCVEAGSLLTGALATHLQELDLSDCLVLDGNEGLEAGLVSAAPSLRGLRLRRLVMRGKHECLFQLISVPLPNGALPSLTALTRLQLAGGVQSAEHLSGLVELRELSIHAEGGITLAAKDLPDSRKLTYLAIFNPLGPGPQGSPSMAVAALSHVGPQLRHLELKTYMTPYQGGTAALLQELAKLTQLTQLGLYPRPLRQPLEATGTAPDAYAAYSSITASSSLQVLNIQGAVMPDGAWQHVFGRGKQLLQLGSLMMYKPRWSSNDEHGVSEQVYKAGLMTAADIAALGSSCPGLTFLMLDGVLEPDAPLHPLLQRLTGLQHLELRGANDADASAVSELSALTFLELSDCSFSDDSVARLTVLTQLEALTVDMRPQEVAAGPGTLDSLRRFESKAPEGAAPDVWSQLAADCERRRDPEAYKAWREAERNARPPIDVFREAMGYPPAGPEGEVDSAAGSDESDDEGGEGDGMPEVCKQQ